MTSRTNPDNANTDNTTSRDSGASRRLAWTAAALTAIAVGAAGAYAAVADDATGVPVDAVDGPTDLGLDQVDREIELESPWEYELDRDCVLPDPPLPTAEIDRGFAVDDDAPLLFFVAEFDTGENAHDAMSVAGHCYVSYTESLAAELGFSPAESDLQRLQELFIRGGQQLETLAFPPSFGDPTPVAFTARSNAHVAVVIDLTNTFDQAGGARLATDLVLASS
ncbi:MAG: hypothetical protein AAGA42_18440 [Actinomycetota bacterium]